MKSDILTTNIGSISVDDSIIETVDTEEIVIEKNENITSIRAYKKENKLLKYLNLFIKRVIDIIGAIVGVITLIPLTIVVAIVNFFDKSDNGPLFYTQTRIGKNGKLFKIYKFRTMVVDADRKLDIYLQENEEARKEYKKYKKLKNDPRITKIGNILRKTSLDEWPQFINVLLSQMSLVGPRPYLPKEREDMGECFETILETKPGITGLWQVAGRSDITFENRILLDLQYNSNTNVINDIKIILKTVKKVLDKNGAV